MNEPLTYYHLVYEVYDSKIMKLIDKNTGLCDCTTPIINKLTYEQLIQKTIEELKPHYPAGVRIIITNICRL